MRKRATTTPPPAPESAAVTHPAQPAGDACPAWCVTAHTHQELERGAYHHDGPDVTLPFAGESTTENLADAWHVKPSQFVSDDDARTVNSPHVEIQDDKHIVAMLTLADARELARMLVEAADTADST